MEALNEHFFEGVEKLLEVWFLDDDNIPTKDNRRRLERAEEKCVDDGEDVKAQELVKELEQSTLISKTADLRQIPRQVWDSLLGLVKCEIISFTRNANIDAYVLSESSMFVSRRRWILKTCGTTTPLACLQPLLRLAVQLGFKGTSDVFYSRKNFVRPELQTSPHRSFAEEVEFLNSVFVDGHSYCLGPINNDCWYLYTHHHCIDTAPRPAKANQKFRCLSIYAQNSGSCNQKNGLIAKNGDNNQQLNSHNNRFNNNHNGYNFDNQKENNTAVNPKDTRNGEDKDEVYDNVPWITVSPVMVPSMTLCKIDPDLDADQTIEILMQDLDANVMEIFTKEVSSNANEATVRSCIHRLLPGMKIDDYLFEPCGYSMNGINEQGEYMTIHITPESRFSYVSFESNVSSVDYGKLIKRVIETFWPRKFLITIFANQLSRAYVEICQLEDDEQHGILNRWQRNDLQCCKFPRFKLLFAQYSSAPS